MLDWRMSSDSDEPRPKPEDSPSAVVPLRPHKGVTANQEMFARLWCQGYSNTDAYALAYDNEMTPEQQAVEAHGLLKNPKIVALCTEILKAAKLEEIDNPQKAFRDLMQDIDGARDDKNWSAVMAGHDKRLKAWGMLKDRQIIENVESMSDEQLVKELAGDDPEKQEMARALIGGDKQS